MPVSAAYQSAPVHAALGEGYFDAVLPAHFPQRILRYRNDAWAQRIGLETLTDDEWVTHFGRFAALPQNLSQPLALRYHGHQFRAYNPDLGDGRGFLFAQMRDAVDGRLLDLGTKGSGQTPYSRQGDGRLTLKGGVRELLATSMLEALGVNTSKTFSLIETGENLVRNDEPSPTRSSVLVRLSHSNIRIGTFQRLAFEGDTAKINRLIDHILLHYFADVGAAVKDASPAERALAVLTETCRRVAETGAAWMAAGFVHGVLNTDNINITGESFDYGPYRFLPHYDPQFTAAYFDHTGLYAYGRQPDTLMWNLTRFAECLMGVAERDALIDALDMFPQTFEPALANAICRRLDLVPLGHEQDLDLVSALYAFLHATKMPFEQVFFDWYGGLRSQARAASSPVAAHYASPEFAAVKTLLAQYTTANPERLSHRYFAGVRPCTLLIDEIETIWAAIADHDHWKPLTDKVAAIAEMSQAFDVNSVLAP
ncbi:MAG: YdiU family protein [Rhodospirillaceae bacterium]|nr:YdiU family protein [Rhodospirillaceae bacterium]